MLLNVQDPVTGVCHSDILVLDTMTWKWSSVEVLTLLASSLKQN